MKRLLASFFLAAASAFGSLSFAQESIVIGDEFEFFQIEKSTLSYFHQDATIDWSPIDAVDYLREKSSEGKRAQYFAYTDALYRSIPMLAVSDVLKPDIRQKFRTPDRSRPNFGFINRPVWYRIKLRYQGLQETKKIIFNARGYLFDLQTFLVGDDQRVSASWRRSIQEPKDLKHRLETGLNLTQTIELRSGQPDAELYFMAYSAVVPHQLELELHSETHLEKVAESRLPFQWAYAGATLGLLLFNLGIFLISRETVNLYYVLFVGTTLLLISEINGFYFNFYTQNAAVFWSHHLLLSLGVHGIFFVAFARRFLGVHPYATLRKLTGAGQIIAIFAAAMYTIGTADIMIPFAFLMIFIVIPLIIGPAIWLMIKREKQALFFVIAFSTYVIGSFLRTLMIQGSLPDMAFLDHIMEIGSLTEALFLSIAMGDKLRTLNLSLATYINKVEEIVEEKTREIRSIMRHINQGIFSILPGVRIHEEYSQHLCRVLDKSDILNQDPIRLLSEGSNLNDDDVSRMKTAVELALNSPFEFELNEEHLPRTLEINGKHLEVDWQVIENESMQTEKLLVTLRDVTEIKKLRGRAAEHEQEVTRLAEILAIDVESCQQFFESSRTMLVTIMATLTSDGVVDADDVRAIFLKYHTIKGHVRSLGFKDLTAAIHKAEQLCSLPPGNAGMFDKVALRDDGQLVLAIFENYETLFRDKLGRSSSNVSGLNRDRIPEMLEALHRIPENYRMMLSEVEAVLHNAYFKDLKAILDDCLERSLKLAADLGKPEPSLVWDGPSIAIKPQSVPLIRNVLIHLLRNAMDHGLEPGEVRHTQGKPLHGVIHVTAQVEGGRLVLWFGDDGQGLNLSKIKSRAVEQGVLDQSCVNPQAIAEAVFSFGVSTASQLSEISGRGVGLDAVRSMLEEGCGTIAIILREAARVTPDAVAAPFQFKIELADSVWVPGMDSGKAIA